MDNIREAVHYRWYYLQTINDLYSFRGKSAGSNYNINPMILVGHDHDVLQEFQSSAGDLTSFKVTVDLDI